MVEYYIKTTNAELSFLKNGVTNPNKRRKYFKMFKGVWSSFRTNLHQLKRFLVIAIKILRPIWVISVRKRMIFETIRSSSEIYIKKAI